MFSSVARCAPQAVVDFFSDDYELFRIPLPAFARRALTELERTNATRPARMERAKLERLLAIPPSAARPEREGERGRPARHCGIDSRGAGAKPRVGVYLESER